MIIIGDPEQDFKEQNPYICTISDFNDVYNNETPEDASRILWSYYFIVFISDTNNPYRDFGSKDERIEEIRAEYCPTLDTSKYAYLEDSFTQHLMSKEEQMYTIQLSKLEEFTKLIKDTDLSSDQGLKRYETYLKLVGPSWKEYERIKKDLLTQQTQTSTRGNTELSAADQREL